MSRDDQDDLDDTAQLDQADTLDDRGVDDLLDEGISPPDRPWAVEDYGLTAREAAGHEDLDHRLARELPDVGAESANDDEFDGGTGDTADTDGETWDDQVGERRAGRLVAPDEGWVRDEDPEAWASDVGINGAGASAEEAAVARRRGRRAIGARSVGVPPQGGDEIARLLREPPHQAAEREQQRVEDGGMVHHQPEHGRPRQHEHRGRLHRDDRRRPRRPVEERQLTQRLARAQRR